MLDPFQYKTIEGVQHILDRYRRKYVVLTPEEWVRQNILHHLVQSKNYPSSLISVEKEIRVGSLKKRYDVLIYKQDKPWLLLECKGEHVTLNDQVLQQTLAYKSVLNVDYISITNGIQAYSYSIPEGLWKEGFPDYE